MEIYCFSASHLKKNSTQLNLIEYIKDLFWYAILKENPRFIDPELYTCWKPFLWKGKKYKHKINSKVNHHEEFKPQQNNKY